MRLDWISFDEIAAAYGVEVLWAFQEDVFRRRSGRHTFCWVEGTGGLSARKAAFEQWFETRLAEDAALRLNGRCNTRSDKTDLTGQYFRCHLTHGHNGAHEAADHKGSFPFWT